MQFTTVRSKEKEYDIYLKSEKLVYSNQEHEKNVFQLFGIGNNWFLAISSLTNTVAAIWREKKQIPAIWRLQNVVHNCYSATSHSLPNCGTSMNNFAACRKRVGLM